MAANGELDIELLIGEIKKYPEIWNLADEHYHDKIKKRLAWVNVCRVFYDDFDGKKEQEKNEICNQLVKKWRNIKDSYSKSEKKKSKSGQGADSGRRYIYARQLSFLETAGATTETQSSFDEHEENDLELIEVQSGQTPTQPEPSAPPRYNQRKRKRDIESSLIDFMKTPIPSTSVAAVSQPNPDRSFFESVLPSICDFTEDQKIVFRCEVLNIIKRMRMSLPQQNYGYPPNISYHIPSNVPRPTYPNPHPSNYLPQTQSYQSSTQLTPTPHSSNYFQQIQHRQSSSGLNNKPVSPSTASLTSLDNQTYNEEDSLDIFSDGN